MQLTLRERHEANPEMRKFIAPLGMFLKTDDVRLPEDFLSPLFYPHKNCAMIYCVSLISA
jgi:hypothetical protein